MHAVTVYKVEIVDGLIVADEAEFDWEAYVRLLFERTREAVRQRPKTPAFDSNAFETEARDFAENLDAITKIGDKPARLSALRAAAAALALGFYHAGNGEVLRALQAERGREGGKKSVAARRVRMRWVEYVRERANEALSRSPTLSDGKVVDAIWDGWNLADLKRPSRRTLEGKVSELRARGTLPQRSGSLRK
jgi:hypothetical protein